MKDILKFLLMVLAVIAIFVGIISWQVYRCEGAEHYWACILR